MSVFLDFLLLAFSRPAPLVNYQMSALWTGSKIDEIALSTQQSTQQTHTGFIRGILRGVRYAKSLRVLFLHRRSPSWTTLVLYSRAVFIFNEPTIRKKLR
jgi:hypothetical protein